MFGHRSLSLPTISSDPDIERTSEENITEIMAKEELPQMFLRDQYILCNVLENI
jgi:hypothetical protein